ncbi:MAG: hypothetical protein ABIE84_06515 [bacterium]
MTTKKMGRSKGLTRKQKMFADYIYRNYNVLFDIDFGKIFGGGIISKAGRKAGYKHRQTAWKLISNPKILTYIEEKLRSQKKKKLPKLIKSGKKLQSCLEEIERTKEANEANESKPLKSNFPISIEMLQRLRRH